MGKINQLKTFTNHRFWLEQSTDVTMDSFKITDFISK